MTIVAGDFHIQIASSISEGAGSLADTIHLKDSLLTGVSQEGGSAAAVETSITTEMAETRPVAAAKARIEGDAASATTVALGALDVGKKVFLLSEGSSDTEVDLIVCASYAAAQVTQPKWRRASYSYYVPAGGQLVHSWADTFHYPSASSGLADCRKKLVSGVKTRRRDFTRDVSGKTTGYRVYYVTVTPEALKSYSPCCYATGAALARVESCNAAGALT